MDIHKPKPFHNFREFLKEYGIIVLGVLTALGLEQAIESWHWREETAAARDALRRDAADNLSAALTRSRQQPCVDRRLEEIAAILSAHSTGKRIRTRGPVGRPGAYFGETDAWQVEVASGALSHMPLNEKLTFGYAFGYYDHFNSVLGLEQDAWQRLGVLDAPDQLEAGDWPPLRQAYAQAQALNDRLKIITKDILTSQTLGQRPRGFNGPAPTGAVSGMRRFCEPILPPQNL